MRKVDSYYIRLILTYAILLVGIFFLNWHVFEILFLFYAEIFFIGFFALMRMLCAWGGDMGGKSVISKIIRNLFLVWFYSMFVAMFVVFIMVFTIAEYETSWSTMNYQVLSLGFIVMGVGYGIDFLFIYLGQNQYLTADPFVEMWRSVFRLMPPVVLVSVVVAPNVKRLPLIDSNTWLVLGVLLVKILIDLVIHWIRKMGLNLGLSQNTSLES